MDQHEFGWALKMLREGYAVTRVAWKTQGPRRELRMIHGPPEYLFLCHDDERASWDTSQEDILATDWVEMS